MLHKQRSQRFRKWSKHELYYRRYVLLKHQRIQVAVEDGVLDGVEDNFDVVRVNGGGEVMVEAVLGFPPHIGEHIQHKGLHLRQRVGVPLVLGVVPADICLRVRHLLLQEVRFV